MIEIRTLYTLRESYFAISSHNPQILRREFKTL